MHCKGTDKSSRSFPYPTHHMSHSFNDQSLDEIPLSEVLFRAQGHCFKRSYRIDVMAIKRPAFVQKTVNNTTETQTTKNGQKNRLHNHCRACY